MSGKVLSFNMPPYTLNADNGDGFLCLLCGHYTFDKETMWAETLRDKAITGVCHMHGTEEYHYCPNCGAEILTMQEWVERRPWDLGKTISQIGKSIREVTA